MVFRKLMHAFGAGGPSVDTVLESGECLPGGALRGEVRLLGGDRAVEVDGITLGLVARVEFEGGEFEHAGGIEFLRAQVAGRFALSAGADHVVPFELAVPWETPITTAYRRGLRGMAIGVKTEVAVVKAVDAGDLDPLVVLPLPAQEAFLHGLSGLGFQVKSADLERGHLRGIDQRLPFYQEIEFFAPQAYGGRLAELEVTFVASPFGMDVVLEADKRGGLFGGSHDTYHHIRIDYATAAQTDWAAHVDGWLRQILAASPSHGYGGHGYGQAAHHGHRRHRGSGMGGIVGGAAGGFLGGLVAGELIEEAGESFFGDDDGGGED